MRRSNGPRGVTSGDDGVLISTGFRTPPGRPPPLPGGCGGASSRGVEDVVVELVLSVLLLEHAHEPADRIARFSKFIRQVHFRRASIARLVTQIPFGKLVIGSMQTVEFSGLIWQLGHRTFGN